MTKKPHKHRDLIIAWANGEIIESKRKIESNWTHRPHPTWDENVEYRIKPENIKYRIALVGDDVFITKTQAGMNSIAHNFYFKKWLTDWIEVEV